MSAEERRCPRCSAEVDHYPTCHTWPQHNADGTEQWMGCFGCASATAWYCLDDDCDWSWTAGLNPRNPRAASNAANAPSWADRGEVY